MVTATEHTRAARARSPKQLQLAVLCLSVLLVAIDNMIINVALPTLSRTLDANTTHLQWIVDAYTLTFAGLLLPFGHLGDRFGRRRVLQIGLVAFAAASLWAASSGNVHSLIAARAVMGVAGALIYPSTLALLTNIFTNPRERAVAIGTWAGVSGLAVALGPVAGGVLLQHYWWGSVFMVNLPIVVVAVVLGALLLPESSDSGEGLDLLGGVLAVATICCLVWTIIEAPGHGWTSATTLTGFAVSLGLGLVLVLWELRHPHPLVDMRLFANPRFGTSTLAISMAFFALFGFIFMVTMYFQMIRGYDTVKAGLATLPYAAVMGVLSPIAMLITRRTGAKVTVAGGMVLMTVGLVLASMLNADSDYWREIVVAMTLMSAGMALATSPATDAIMTAVPRERAGMGSAMNDTARQLGGALGIAIVGSIMSSYFASGLRDNWRPLHLSEGVVSSGAESLATTVAVAERVPPALAAAATEGARSAFMDGLQAGSLFAAAATLIAGLLAAIFLPAHAPAESLHPNPTSGGPPEPYDDAAPGPASPTGVTSTTGTSRSPG